MAFASYQRLPYIKTYEQAFAFIEKTAPIRGRDIIPLGARRDADKFNIRITPTGDIEVLFYRSVILTYLKDGDLLFSSPPGGWGITEAWIFECLLPQVARAKATKGFMHLHAVNGADYVYPEGKTRAYASLQIIEPTEHYVWRLKRTETNKVRTRYGAFYRYVKGMVGVRKVLHKYTDEYIVELLVREFVDNLTPQWLEESSYLRHKPRITKSDRLAFVGAKFQTHAEWRKLMGKLIEMIEPQDDAQKQAENFYKAFLSIASTMVSHYLFTRAHLPADAGDDNTVQVQADSMGRILDEMLFKYYSDDVFVQEKVPAGRVPDDRYALWVTRP